MAKRGEWALRQLTLHYCKHGGSSRGIREFIANGAADFARRNPQIEVRTAVRQNRHPFIDGFYPGDLRSFVEQGARYEGCPRDRNVELGVKNSSAEDVLGKCEELRTRTGAKSVSTSKLKKWWFTKHPSIQGMWTTGMFKPGGIGHCK